MKGKRDPEADWDWRLGLAILSARRDLYVRLSHEVGIPHPERFWRSHEALGAFMGLSDARVQQIERKALRKLRIIFIYRRHELKGELQDALEGYGRNGHAEVSTH